MEYFAGLDVSLRSCALCVVDASGSVACGRDLVCQVGEITDCLASFSHPVARIGFKAGTTSQHLFYLLTNNGFDVVCVETHQVCAALSAMRNKTDRNDARGIAHILRTGWFSPVHKKSREAHGTRALLSCRKALLNRTIDLAARSDEVCLRMMTLPGVGPIAALTPKAAIDDPTRFKRSRNVAAHFGLKPRRYQSGEHDNPGRTSRVGDRCVRATLYAAANTLLMRTMAGSQIKS
ncbi:Transposase [Poseidonocella pacifica]|uniref:Transposase n=1 Tax=Poseidonocella pacifica TaxID=871651 RepID=A0A1I0YPZ9_9RHOB|nr:transposase [Poseidonocella pacifica]SFB15027.1 Transposase [Poseidonocella pacifica]